ncbi:MAG: hypothetical protein QOE65_1613 [Solirubrobacteraceae bacterium]|jgi:hypothetical protein|nr:hypothetical protein [Solirubrobacteraceae bacterium]
MLARLSLRARAAALLPLAALAVHDGFYRLGEPHAGSGSGHGYLAGATALAGVLAALVVAALVARLAHAWRGVDAAEPGVAWRRLWLVTTLGLLAVFALQECLEAAVAGHAVAFAGSGAWVAVPLALAAGGLLTLVLRGARAVAAAVAGRGARRPVLRPSPRAGRLVARPAPRPCAPPLALCAAGRAPPPFALSR